MNRKSLSVGLVVGFLIGVVVTSGLAHHFQRSRRGPKSPAAFLNRLSHKLDLNDEQKKSIGTVLEKTHVKMKGLHEEMRPKFDTIRADTRKNIQVHLNDQQKIKFAAIEAEMDKRLQKRRARYEDPPTQK